MDSDLKTHIEEILAQEQIYVKICAVLSKGVFSNILKVYKQFVEYKITTQAAQNYYFNSSITCDESKVIQILKSNTFSYVKGQLQDEDSDFSDMDIKIALQEIIESL